MKRVIRFLYDTWYGALVVFLTLVGIQACHNFLIANFKFAMPGWTDMAMTVLALLVIISELSCLAAIIVSFCFRKWKRAFVQIALGSLVFVLSLAVAFMTVVYEMFGPSEDHFNDSLTIPAGLKYEAPEEFVSEGRRQKYEDDEVFAKAMANPGADYNERADEAYKFYKKILLEKGDIVRTYLRRNPLWERDPFSRRENYTRKLWADGQYCSITVTTARPCKVDYAAKEGCKVPEHGWYAGAMSMLDEFAKVDSLKDEGEIDSILPKPKPYVSKERPDFVLRNSFQGGIYEYKATVNPGEDGEVYLKAYEVTKEIPLSVSRLKPRTLEKVEGKGEHVIGKEFTIYEGDWGHYYAARIEIWFIPACGGKERKLKEKVFKVQGWMR